MKTVKDIYKAHFEEYSLNLSKETKYAWAASEVFDLCTYDDGLDEKFVKTILEVLKVIRDRTNFEYIMDEHNYTNYILVCQILYKFNWIEWGTSIRGAWLEDYHYGQHPHLILEEMERWGPEYEGEEMKRHSIEAVPFTVNNLLAFIEFMEE